MNLEFKQFELNKFDAPNFIMSPVELKDYIDFDVKRIYFITDVKNEKQSGAHCHKIEKELFILLKGTCTAIIDKGDGLEEIQMTAPTTACYVGEYVWHQFKNFSDDSILLAVSSTNYSPDRSDYIEDYGEYQEALKNL